MGESKHTPGPWFATGRYIGTKNHKSFIAECRDRNGNWSDEAPASDNARLIAAAPELLAALIETLAVATRNEEGDFADRARAALAKAGASHV